MIDRLEEAFRENDSTDFNTNDMLLLALLKLLNLFVEKEKKNFDGMPDKIIDGRPPIFATMG